MFDFWQKCSASLFYTKFVCIPHPRRQRPSFGERQELQWLSLSSFPFLKANKCRLRQQRRNEKYPKKFLERTASSRGICKQSYVALGANFSDCSITFLHSVDDEYNLCRVKHLHVFAFGLSGLLKECLVGDGNRWSITNEIYEDLTGTRLNFKAIRKYAIISLNFFLKNAGRSFLGSAIDVDFFKRQHESRLLCIFSGNGYYRNARRADSWPSWYSCFFAWCEYWSMVWKCLWLGSYVILSSIQRSSFFPFPWQTAPVSYERRTRFPPSTYHLFRNRSSWNIAQQQPSLLGPNKKHFLDHVADHSWYFN